MRLRRWLLVFVAGVATVARPPHIADASNPVTSSAPPLLPSSSAPSPPRGDPSYATGPALSVPDSRAQFRAPLARMVRTHLQEVRYCYTRALVANPNLEGTVVVLFVIGRDRNVGVAQIAFSTMTDGSVDACVVGAMRRWQLDRAPDGIVLASQRFEFRRACYQLGPSVGGRAPAIDNVDSPACRELR